MGVNTGTNRSRGGLQVNDNNGASTVFAYGVNEIIVTAGTLVNNGQGTVTITTGGGGGGSGTVTSITNAADSGTGTAITNSGTFTYTGGTNITTAVSGTTVTINNDSASTVAAGNAGEVAFYTGANALGGDSDFTFDNTTGLSVTGSEAKIKSIDTTNNYIVSIFGGGGPQINFGQVPNEAAYMEISAAGGRNIIDSKARDFELTTTSNGNIFYADISTNSFGVGAIFSNTSFPDTTLQVGEEDSATNTVLRPFKLTRTTSAAIPASSIGVGMEFEVETSASNNEVGATIEAVTTDVTATSEDFDMTFNLMAGGATAAEKMRIGSNGAIKFNNAYTFPTADGNANEILQTDGAGNITFAAAGGGTPAGADTEIQFNNAGAFGASSRLTFNNGTNTLTVGSAFTNTPVLFSQSAANNATPTEGGNITSNLTTVSMEINAGLALTQEIGMKQTTTAYQVETGKTTTQSFGQTQKTVLAASGTPYACYPSEGGLIVVNDAGGAGAITLNLVLGSDGGSYASNANPPNVAGGGTPVTGVPDKAGYGTWQIGDQVTVLAANESGNVPAISIISTTLTTNGSGGSSDPVLDAGAAATINGVNSFTTPNTITTNYTAKTYILVSSVGGIFGAEWVAIG